MNYRTALLTWLALLMILLLNVIAAFLIAGNLQHMASISSAIVMAALVMLFFMRLSSANGLVRVFAVGALLWWAFFLFITLTEVLSR